ncbi:hypothetical protein ACFQY7_25400 [Actinomadura luteofluorescens]|uniref:hypothetical protein n=1 Tax=Actinomadura luteofluorescens TaxID=46163 RepID=UPI003627179E
MLLRPRETPARRATSVVDVPDQPRSTRHSVVASRSLACVRDRRSSCVRRPEEPWR